MIRKNIEVNLKGWLPWYVRDLIRNEKRLWRYVRKFSALINDLKQCFDGGAIHQKRSLKLGGLLYVKRSSLCAVFAVRSTTTVYLIEILFVTQKQSKSRKLPTWKNLTRKKRIKMLKLSWMLSYRFKIVKNIMKNP